MYYFCPVDTTFVLVSIKYINMSDNDISIYFVKFTCNFRHFSNNSRKGGTFSTNVSRIIWIETEKYNCERSKLISGERVWDWVCWFCSLQGDLRHIQLPYPDWMHGRSIRQEYTAYIYIHYTFLAYKYSFCIPTYFNNQRHSIIQYTYIYIIID